MSARHYGLLPGLAASLSLTLAACDTARTPDAVASTAPAAPQKTAQRDQPDFSATLWTVLGLAKTDVERSQGPQTGASVSPVLWQATLDTLRFAGTSSEDPMTGLLVTKWYTPPGRTDERLQVTAFVKSRALSSDSIAVSVQRQALSPRGGWETTPVATDVGTGLEAAILQRARQIHAERYRNTMYN
jgi:uncharacterized protein DUF3576